MFLESVSGKNHKRVDEEKKICLMVIIFTTITTMMTSDGSSTEDGGDENRWKSLNLVFTYITHKHKWKIIIFYGKYRSCWKYTKKKRAQCCFCFVLNLALSTKKKRMLKKEKKKLFFISFCKKGKRTQRNERGTRGISGVILSKIIILFGDDLSNSHTNVKVPREKWLVKRTKDKLFQSFLVVLGWECYVFYI